MNKWNRFLIRIVPALIVFVATWGAADGFVDPGEMERKAGWVGINLTGDAKQVTPPFSFVYDGRPSGTLLPAWSRKDETARIDESRTRHTTTWTDPKTRLEVRCVAVEYADFPAVEWTVYFKNTGGEKTPILENVQGLDARFERAAEGEFVLHHWKGDTSRADLYQPLEQRLGPNTRQKFAPNGGRPTNGEFPYYDIVMPGGGLLLAVGWPGQWATSFIRDGGRSLQIVAGQELTHLYLESGEEIRTPLIALLFWQGSDAQRSHNLWRRWMWAHNVPRTADGQLPPPILFGNTSAEFGEMINANEENQKHFIDRYREEGVPIDYWWMDAGWYPCDGQWPKTGTWEPDTNRFPKGLRAISDHARAKGVRTLVWFEPERVAGGTWLATNHPEWLLDGKLLNLGNPEARKWLTDHVDRTLREQGIDLYRQDFNMDPLEHWRRNDAPDRKGMTENLHVQGYLAYWDELRRRHPNLIIDSCASGGRRNDLETLRRAVPLHPTDYNYGDLTAKQAFHFSLFQWIPYFGSNTVPIDTVDAYAFRSGHGMGTVLGYDLRRRDLGYDRLRTLAEQWKQVAPFFYGDYYPLTPYSLNEEDWIAWQFHRPEEGDGVVQAFRRPRSMDSSILFPLHGLDPNVAYELKDLDGEATLKMSGRELTERGLPVERDEPRQAVVILYGPLKTLSAILKADPRKGEMPLAVAFDGRDSYDPDGRIVKYAWQLGDGWMAEGPAAEHVFDQPGTYTAHLIVTNDKGEVDTADTTVVVTPIDTVPPAILSVSANGNPTQVVVTFSEPVEQASAEAVANYAIEHGITIESVSLGADRMTATLKTSPLSEGATYSFSVNNVKDRAAKPNPIATDSQKTFRHTSLIAHWKLDDGKGSVARDSSGNGHHARLVNGPTWVETPLGRVLRFDGVDDYLAANTYFPDLAIPFTISVWVNPAATQVRHADILGNHGEPYVGINLQQEGDMTNAFGFGYGDGQKWQGTGHAQLKAEEWQHVAVVCDGAEAILYVNGEAKARRAAKGPLAPNPAQNFKIGQGYHTGRYFHGMLRDVRIYGRALSAAEIAASRPAQIGTTKMPAITTPIMFNTPEADAILSALEVFPPDNPWNQKVTDWPLHPNSKNIIASIGPDKPLRYNPDMGFVLVPPDQKRVDVRIVDYPGESDKGPFPVPDVMPIEGWPVGYQRDSDGPRLTLEDVQRDKPGRGGDRHGIVVDPVDRMLYEFYAARRTDSGWQAAQASVFDLKTNRLRPEGWTSADAAGLPIFPAVVRYDELRRGRIGHAMRVTVRRTRRAYVAPATHFASRYTNEDYPRMGERLRLRRDYDTSAFSPEVRTILEGLKTYGMFVADNGIEWAISVAPDPRIPSLHEELRRVKGSAFEVVVAPR